MKYPLVGSSSEQRSLRSCRRLFLGGSTYPSSFRSGNPLGELRPWGMTHHRAGAYAREAWCRAGANKKPVRRDVAMDRRPAISEHGLVGGPE
jgi:hypothetical protein